MKNFFKVISIVLVLCLLSTPFSVFAQNESNSIYNEDRDEYYDTLSAAFDDAESGETLYIVKNYTLNSSLAIPDGVTLIIPSSSANNDSFTQTSVITGNPVENSAHVTLTISNGAVLTIPSDATLLVAGYQQSTQPKSGYLTGDYGKITINSGSSLVNNGALYARGRIDGDGTVTSSDGSTVYQLFQIADWRGGSASSNAYDEEIFPFNLYEVNSIRCHAVYNSGASLLGQYYVVVSGSFFGFTFSIPVSGNVNIIGSGALLACASGNIETNYSSSSNTLTATINGAVQTGDISLSIYGTNYNSAGLLLPFGYHMDVEVANTGALTIANDLKLMPGCDLTVKNGGSMTIANGGSLYFYDTDAYSNTFSFNGTWYPSADATLTVETGATVNYNGSYGGLATSDSTGGNFDGITMPANPGTTTVYEYANNTTATGVTFYYA